MAPVLIVGATGGTGEPALQGLAEGGLQAGSAAVLTRRTDSPAALALTQQGYSLVRGDLDDPASLAAALQGVRAVYVHAGVRRGEEGGGLQTGGENSRAKHGGEICGWSCARRATYLVQQGLCSRGPEGGIQIATLPYTHSPSCRRFCCTLCSQGRPHRGGAPSG